MEMLIIIIFAMLLAFCGMLMVYYNIKSKDRKKKISKLMFDGVTSLRCGGYDKAAIYFKVAYEYSEEMKDYQNMAEALYNIGLVCKEQNDADNAVYFFQESSKIYEEIEDYSGRDRAHKAADSIK